MRLMHRIFGPVVAMVFLFGGCKEEDWVPPTITVTAPVGSFNLQVPDTLHVSFSANDETRLTAISVRLMTDNGVQLAVAPSISLEGNEFNGTVSIILKDKNITGGECYVSIEANDGTNTAYSFVQGQVVPVVKELRAVYALVRQGAASAVYRIDSLFQSAVPFGANAADARLLRISSAYDKLFLSGGKTATLTCVDLLGQGTGWDATMPFASDTTAYLDMGIAGDEVFVSAFDGQFRGYDFTGALIRNDDLMPDRPENIHAYDEYVLADRRATNGTHFIDRIRTQNGFRMSTLQVPVDVRAIATKDEDEFYVVGMQGITPRLLIYEHTEPSYFDPHDLPAGQVYTAMAGDGDMLFISHSNGVYRYRYNPTLLDLVLPGTVPSLMVFEPVHARMVMAVGNEVRVYDLAAQPVATVTLPGEVLGLDLHHTR